jgi:hypothetical protein
MADSDIQEAASSLLENSIGAFRSDDTQMAKLLIVAALKLWEEAHDRKNAAKARELYRSFSQS